MFHTLRIWCDAHIIKGWHKTWTLWLSILAIAGPELLQIALDNLDTLTTAVPVMTDMVKSQIRLCLLVLIPIVRVLKKRPSDTEKA